jgi:hypothetical protein
MRDMIGEALQFAADFGAIVWRGVGKLLGLRREEKASSLATGQSVVAAIIVIGILAVAIAILVGWLFSA